MLLNLVHLFLLVIQITATRFRSITCKQIEFKSIEGKDEPDLTTYFKLCLYWLLWPHKTNSTQKNGSYIKVDESFVVPAGI